jgi:hypothetical protein
MDAVKCMPQVERACAERVAFAARHEARQIRLPLDHFRRGFQSGPPFAAKYLDFEILLRELHAVGFYPEMSLNLRCRARYGLRCKGQAASGVIREGKFEPGEVWRTDATSAERSRRNGGCPGAVNSSRTTGKTSASRSQPS